jgi:hypothetical protein
MPRLVRAVARTAVVAGTATAVSNRVSRRQGERWADQGASQPAYMAPVEGQTVSAAPAYQQPAPTGLGTDEKIAQLKELAALKEAGVLTEVEFEVQKAAILNG